jgi:hypothetical protein
MGMNPWLMPGGGGARLVGKGLSWLEKILGIGAKSTRALEAADFGAQASIKALQGSLTVQGNVATASVSYFEGNLGNAWAAANALKGAAMEAGATTLRIEGTIANPALLRGMERLFGPASRGAVGGAQDYWVIPLGP